MGGIKGTWGRTAEHRAWGLHGRQEGEHSWEWEPGKHGDTLPGRPQPYTPRMACRCPWLSPDCTQLLSCSASSIREPKRALLLIPISLSLLHLLSSMPLTKKRRVSWCLEQGAGQVGGMAPGQRPRGRGF